MNPERILNLQGNATDIFREKLIAKLNLSKLDKFEAGWFAQVREDYQNGDEFWSYADMGFLSGWGGCVLLRGGRYVARVVTMMS